MVSSLAAARRVAADVLGEVAARGEMARKVYDSYVAFRERTAPWSRISIKAVLAAREGRNTFSSPRACGDSALTRRRGTPHAGAWRPPLPSSPTARTHAFLAEACAKEV